MQRWFYLECFEYYIRNIPDAFRELGIPMTVPSENITPVQLKRQLRRVKPDVILTTGWTPLQRKENFDVIKAYCEQYRAFHVNWQFEDPLHTNTWGKFIAEVASPDYIFTHSFESPNEYRAIGIPSSYLPFACNPELHKREKTNKLYQSDVALVAKYNPLTLTQDSFRMDSLRTLLLPLIRKKFDVAIWGKGWQDHKDQLPFDIPNKCIRGPLPYEDVPNVYASAKIILGIQNTRQLLTRRTFECLGSGGFLLTNPTPAVKRHFIPGKHVAGSQNQNETLRQARYYLKNRDFRNQIAENGQQDVYLNHTYTQRIQEMIDTIEPYVKAKKENSVAFALPQRLKKELRPHINVSAGRKLTASNQYVIVKRYGREIIRTYMKFRLRQESMYDINTALLKLFLALPPKGTPLIHCHEILSDWDPQSLDKGRLPELATEPVGSLRLNRFDTRYPWKNNWYTLNITSLVNAWVKGERQNFGICLLPDRNSHDFIHLASADWAGRNRYIRAGVYPQRVLPHLELGYKKNTSDAAFRRWSAFES